jgi:prevent-host-death family protein
MAQMAASAAREEFAEVLNRVAYGKERIVLHRHGKPVVAIIPVEDLQLLERLIEEEEDRIDVEEARRILADPTDEGVPLEQVKAELGL